MKGEGHTPGTHITDLNVFWDIKVFMNWKGWGIPQVDPHNASLDVHYHKEYLKSFRVET